MICTHADKLTPCSGDPKTCPSQKKWDQMRRIAADAHTITAHETRPIEDPEREGLLGMERVELGTFNAGFVAPASPCCDAPGDEHRTDCPHYGHAERDNDEGVD
ncbi:hypothetical protein [Mycobacterium conspicuum]|uniref:Uncharacterized protein n=1 Tax=Mycobacterium conspicuum TaxID=44010 RepID=A0A7I7Y5Y1_9MYCO|nr:hypothetical protein [Mycobacterium conspicuum]BBZ37097.1 hypothetical protein MCNS_01600 [Mycobacterium conspicuum]